MRTEGLCLLPQTVSLMERVRKSLAMPFPYFSGSFCLNKEGNHRGWGPLFPTCTGKSEGGGAPKTSGKRRSWLVRFTFVKPGWGHLR